MSLEISLTLGNYQASVLSELVSAELSKIINHGSYPAHISDSEKENYRVVLVSSFFSLTGASGSLSEVS